MTGVGKEEPKPHFVLIPLAAQGHIIPMIDMAHLLAEHGARVSFITTPANIPRIKPIINRVEESNIPIQFIELPFPSAKFGVPEGCESVELIPSKTMSRSFFDAIYALAEPLEFFLETLDSRPNCMITDMCNGWTGPVARKFGIPRIIFHGPCCFFISASHNMEINKVFDCVSDELELVTVPDFLVKLEVNKAQTPGSFLNHPGYEDIHKITQEEESSADGVVINTFEELERPFIEEYEKAIGKKVWAIGPLCLCNKDINMKATRGNKEAADELQVLKWLDGRDVDTVLYVNFGSIVYTNALQLMEIGGGLEASNKPFIWVIKKTEMADEVKQWLSDGFEERTKDRGLIIIGWAPQMVILSHSAVGGFMTHCGWNSMLEAISMGVPMITWPHFSDQFVNENLIVDVLKIGISLGVKQPNYASPDVMVKKDCVETAVLALMNEGEVDGETRRARVKDFGEKAMKAMEEGGSSCVNMIDMIRLFADCEIKKDGILALDP